MTTRLRNSISFSVGLLFAFPTLDSRAQNPPRAEPVSSTTVALPSGRSMVLVGEWSVESSLWGEHALVLGHAHLDVLEPRTSTRRQLIPYGKLEVMSGWPVIGADERPCYKWLDERRQLVAIDLTAGSLVSLTKLPMRGGFFSKRMDGLPVYQGPAAIEDLDANRVWFVLNRSGDQEGGWLCGVDRTAGRSPIGTEVRITSGSVSDWVYSRKRARVFALVNESGWTRLCSVGLDGGPSKSLAMPPGPLHGIVLSPEEDRLLFVRHFVDTPTLDPKKLASEGSDSIKIKAVQPDGGFVILDLDSFEATEGPKRGHEASFTPDGRQVIYPFGWELKRFDLVSGTDEVIAVVAAGPEPLPESPSYFSFFSFPVWSPDGRTCVVNVGEDECTQVIDLVDRCIFLAPYDSGRDFAWVPKGVAIKRDGDSTLDRVADSASPRRDCAGSP